MSIYLDHNATTPPRPGSLQALAQAASAAGNPASLHQAGQRARRAVERARDAVRRLVGAPVGGTEAQQVQVIFTGGGTESDALALTGLARARRRACGAQDIWLSPLEHPAVVAAAESLVPEGFTLQTLPLDGTGRVDVGALDRERLSQAALCAVMLAHNVTGLVQPVEEIARALPPDVPLHVDAVQAAGKIPIAWPRLGAHSLALAGHKLGGPRGIGALVLAPGVELEPLWGGGGQERGLRSGSVPMALVVAFGRACEEALADLQALAPLRSRLLQRLAGHAIQVGDEPLLPNTVAVRFEGVGAIQLVRAASERGLCISAGAACHGDTQVTSPVLQAMGLGPQEAREVVRLSLGWSTTGEEVDRAAELLIQLAASLREHAS